MKAAALLPCQPARAGAARNGRAAPAPARASLALPGAAGATWSPGAPGGDAVLLPGVTGATWTPGARGSDALLFGGGEAYPFVLRRTRVGGEGLVVRTAGTSAAPYRPDAAAPPAPAARAPVCLALAGTAASVVIDTDFEVVADAPPPCFGIVRVGGEADATPAPAAPRHRRRTRRVRFTCNLCGEANEAAVNPHAWARGSVFCRCGGCELVHKLKDNLKIFSELGGPVFPPRHLREDFLVREVLDRIAAARAARDGGGGGDAPLA
jgi:hypothetical protein